MAFWQNNNIEPKRQYRFVLRISDLPTYIIKGVKKPGWKMTSTPHQYLNHTFFYPGRVTWDDITFTIVDTVGDNSNGTKLIMDKLKEAGYTLPAEDDYNTISKASATRAVGQVVIETIDAEGAPVESWVLNNAWITAATFGDLSYDQEALLNISLTLKYDNAFINIGGQSIPEHSF